jgi:hypothetical protein
MDQYAHQLDAKVNEQLKETKFELVHGGSKQKKSGDKDYYSEMHQEDMKIDNYYGSDETDQHSAQKKQQKYTKRSPPRKLWKDTDQEDTDIDKKQYSKIKNSNTFQKYLQNEASQQEKLKQSQIYEDDKRQGYEDEGRNSSARRGQGSRQTFGDKVQRFSKAIVGNGNGEDEEEQYYQNQYPPNIGYEQPTHQTPQNMYQGQPGQMMSQRFSQAEGNYHTPQTLPGEKELAGYSEQILSNQGLTPSYLAQQQMYNQGFMGNTNQSQEPYNMKNYQVDPKQSLYVPNMASVNNFQPGLMYPQQFQASQQFQTNTFGNDPNMSMYAQAPKQQEFNSPGVENYNTLNDAYATNQKGEIDFLNEKLSKVQNMYGKRHFN